MRHPLHRPRNQTWSRCSSEWIKRRRKSLLRSAFLGLPAAAAAVMFARRDVTA